jgi:hypothetical protein
MIVFDLERFSGLDSRPGLGVSTDLQLERDHPIPMVADRVDARPGRFGQPQAILHQQLRPGGYPIPHVHCDVHHGLRIAAEQI